MIDCVFLLLIFFMCAAKFKTLDSRLQANLPAMGENPAPTPEVTPRRIELKIAWYTTIDGKQVAGEICVLVGQMEIGRYMRPALAESAAVRADLQTRRGEIYAQLRDVLRAMEREQAPHMPCPTLIAPDPLTPSDDVIQALDSVIAAGIGEVSFAGNVSDVAKIRLLHGVE